MTRFARAGKRKFLEATSWENMSGNKQGSSSAKLSNMGAMTSLANHLYWQFCYGLLSNRTGSDKTNVQSSTQNDADSLPSKKKKVLSKKKKVITHKSQVQKAVLDPKKKKQIEARRLRRKKRKCCFVCREYGHQALECPKRSEMGVGACFKCGSSDHTTKKCKATTNDASSGLFPFAKCFICQEKGHLVRSCPENPRGLYPQGGGCKVCGSVEHLKRDCPQLLKKKNKGNTTEVVSLTIQEDLTHKSADAQDIMESDIGKQKKKCGKKAEKVVNF